MTRARDWAISKVVIDSTNNQFRINETGVGGNGVITISVTAGEYWLHYDTSINSTLPSLYKAVVDALNASAAANGYEIESNTPSGSPYSYGAGLLIGVNAVIEWQIEAGNAGFTMDPRWFGLDAQTYVASVRPDSTYSVDSEKCIEGVWRSTTAGIDGRAQNKRSRRTRITSWSHDDPDNRFGLVWKRRRQRTLEYEYVPAANLFELNDEDGYFLIADKGVGDTNGSFETVWSRLAENEQVIMVYNCDVWDLQVDTHESELVRLTSVRNADDVLSVASVQRVNGEHYNLSFDVTIVDSVLPGYDH